MDRQAHAVRRGRLRTGGLARRRWPGRRLPGRDVHDLGHTHVAGGAPLPHIQARLGHESITTTIDTYGHPLPADDELISGIIDTALSGRTIRPRVLA